MSDDDESRLLKFIQAVAIDPKSAGKLVAGFEKKAGTTGDSSKAARRRAGERIVGHYAKLAATSGGATALMGIVPGVGTALALVGGTSADVACSLKLQLDMCRCLAVVYGHDLDKEAAQHLAFLVMLGGALEEGGRQAAVRIGTKAGVSMVRTYLKGAVLTSLKEMLKRVGIIFTRKALEKAIPFGVGVVVGGSSNYLLTKYIGGKALDHFELDAEMSEVEPPAA